MSESLMQAAEPTEAPVVTEPQQEVAPVSDRPEWLPEKYKSGEDLAKAYKELESKLGSKEEDLRSKIMEELQAEAFKDRPASAGEYQLPDIVDEESGVDSKLLQWWSEHSFENGYSQEEFQQGIQMYMEAIGQSGPDLEAEVKKLGENANQRIQAVSLFANKFFPSEVMPALERLCETSEGIVALEHIMDSMKDVSVAESANSASGISEQSLREMMKDERYWKNGSQDRDYIRQVDEGFRKIYARG